MALHLPLLAIVLLPLLIPLLLPLGPLLLPVPYRSPATTIRSAATQFNTPHRANHPPNLAISEAPLSPHAAGATMAADARPPPPPPRAAPPPPTPPTMADLAEQRREGLAASATTTLSPPPPPNPPVQVGVAVASAQAGEVATSYGELARLLSSLGFHEMAAAAADMDKSPPLARLPGAITVFAIPDHIVRAYNVDSSSFLNAHLIFGYYSSSVLAARSTASASVHAPTASPGSCIDIIVKHALRRPRIYACGVKVSHPDRYNDGKYVVHAVRRLLHPVPCPRPWTTPRLSMKVGRGTGTGAGSRSNAGAAGGGMGAAAAVGLGVAGAAAAVELGRWFAKLQAGKRRRRSYQRIHQISHVDPDDAAICQACRFNQNAWQLACCKSQFCSACVIMAYLNRHSRSYRTSTVKPCDGAGVLVPVPGGPEMDPVHTVYAFSGAAPRSIGAGLQERRFFNVTDLMSKKPPRQLVVTVRCDGTRIAERFEEPKAIPLPMD